MKKASKTELKKEIENIIPDNMEIEISVAQFTIVKGSDVEKFIIQMLFLFLQDKTKLNSMICGGAFNALEEFGLITMDTFKNLVEFMSEQLDKPAKN